MSSPIQWYPGHIAKLERTLQQYLKQVEIVIEVRDARIPETTGYTMLSEKIRAQKPVLMILNKADLADPEWTKAWVTFYKKHYPGVMSFDSLSGKKKAEIITQLCRLGEPKMRQLESKGLKRRAFRVGIVGMPNVGKSSLINAMVGTKKTKTGHRAGVTRVPQWIRIHPQVDLMDTPGIIPSRLESEEMGQLLASVYSVGDAAFDEESIIPFFLERVTRLYPTCLKEAFDLPENAEVSIESIAQRRGFILPGGELDYKRAAQAILKDYRLGKIGHLTLERPHQGDLTIES